MPMKNTTILLKDEAVPKKEKASYSHAFAQKHIKNNCKYFAYILIDM